MTWLIIYNIRAISTPAVALGLGSSWPTTIIYGERRDEVTQTTKGGRIENVDAREVTSLPQGQWRPEIVRKIDRDLLRANNSS